MNQCASHPSNGAVAMYLAFPSSDTHSDIIALDLNCQVPRQLDVRSSGIIPRCPSLPFSSLQTSHSNIYSFGDTHGTKTAADFFVIARASSINSPLFDRTRIAFASRQCRCPYTHATTTVEAPRATPRDCHTTALCTTDNMPALHHNKGCPL